MRSIGENLGERIKIQKQAKISNSTLTDVMHITNPKQLYICYNPKCRSIKCDLINEIVENAREKICKYPFSSSSIISCFSLNIRMLFFNHYLATLSSFLAGHIHHSPRTSYKTTMAASQLPSILRT